MQTPTAISVSLSPTSANVPTSGSVVLTVTVSGAGSSSVAVTLSAGGIPGGNATVGTIAATAVSGGVTTALYTAPLNVPSPANVTVTATSVTDATKSASAILTIVCATANSISPGTATLALGQTQAFTASFCGIGNAPITWDVNGVTNGNAALGTISVANGTTALYTAPASVPSANPLTIHASATASNGNAVTVSSMVTIVSQVGIAISPTSATVSTNQRVSFTASVSNTSDSGALWFVNGIANGNASVGQVCQMGTSPCVAPTAPVVGAVDYVAPSQVPGAQPIVLTAVSDADNTRSASALITVVAANGNVSISISPQYAFLPAGNFSTQQFSARVVGSANQAVTWSVQSGVAGAGCGGTACGSVTNSGIFTAPNLAPSPNAISLSATSQADPTKSATATIALTSGPVIETLLPASVMAGVVQSIPLSVTGSNFSAGSGSTASVILIGGTARSTTCASTTTCTTALNPTDIQVAGSLSVQIHNPGSPGALSNPVAFVVVPFDVSQSVIALTTSEPIVAGSNIVTVEPTSAAASSPLNVDSVGLFTAGTCGIQGSPLTITRPTFGTAVTSICVHGTGLDASYTYTFISSRSAPNDIVVTPSTLTGFLPNTIELDLQISNSTAAGVRSLFITDINNNRAVATGLVEIQ